jgi:Enterobacteriaceae phage serine recombinase
VYNSRVEGEQFTRIKRHIGYARVSRDEQSLDLQIDALTAAGCQPSEIYSDHGVSGKTTRRPQLDRCLAEVGAGDILVVWKLDRLGRSLQHLIEVINLLHDRDAGFKSITEGMDTSTNQGRLVFHMFGALAEFERGLIVERTMAGLAAAKTRGVTGGRLPALNADEARIAKDMIKRGISISDVARVMKVSRATIYRDIEMTDRELAARDERAAARTKAGTRRSGRVTYR